MIAKPPLKIYMNSTNVDQEKKWDKRYKEDILTQNLKTVDDAIKAKYDLIVFPETAFPLVLNENSFVKELLLERSNHIAIITGALNKYDGMYYNSSYLFNKGKMQIANKVVLVPFGEAVPLPEKLRDIINDTFYDGAKDYETAKKSYNL